MNAEDQKLKELFNKELATGASTAPSFDNMWEKARQGEPKRLTFVWRMAASLALVGIIGVLLYRSNSEERNAGEIASWKGSTESLIPGELSTGTSALSTWNSPTAFLLTETNNTQ